MRMKERTEGSVGRRYRMNVDLDRELARELRKALIDEGKTLSEWVREEAIRFLRDRSEKRDGE
jgi:metal-responsive CopG/Arc/MetJ family transcriptional regulator